MFVTLYHKNKDGYEKSVYENIKMHFSNGIKVNDNTFTQSDNYVIRIFTDEKIYIAPEDKMEIGKSESDTPSLEALTVLRITDNRVGTHKHYKVECI